MCVSDNGRGVPEIERDNLFLRLYRSDSSQQIEGAGLGLAIVKEIADRYGATVGIESIVGQGSRFRVCFPHRCPVDIAQAAASAP